MPIVDVFVATAIYASMQPGDVSFKSRPLMSMGQTLSMAFRIADAEADTEDGEVAEGVPPRLLRT